MPAATVTSKGQITIPKDVRDDLNLKPGAHVLFVKLPSGQYRLVARTGKVQDLAGMLAQEGGTSLTTDEMNEAIGDAAADSGGRGL